MTRKSAGGGSDHFFSSSASLKADTNVTDGGYRVNEGQDDIYNYPKRVRKALAGLKELSEDDRKLIEKFVEVLKAQNLSLGRVAKYIYHLKVSSKILRDQAGTDFNHATAEAMKKLFVSLNESNYKPMTRTDFVTVLKRFYQWLRAPEGQYAKWRKKHEYPPEVEDLPSSIKHNETVLPSNLVREEEVRLLIEGANHPMIRAFIALSDELGPRPGEILRMSLGDVMHDGTAESTVMVRLRGKTGERLLYVVKSTSLLAQWLDIHPLRHDLDAPLWLNLSNRNRHRRWSYLGYKITLSKLVTKAGIKRNIYPYIFRHTAATRDAKLGFSEAQLCMKYGWVIGSDKPRVYIHMVGKDLKQKIMETYAGGDAPTVKPEPQVSKCPRCSSINQPAQNYCYRCGSLLRYQNKGTEYEELKSEISEIKEALRTLLNKQQ
jgi:site-specific recombinase XerD